MAVDKYEKGEKRYLSPFVRLLWAWRGAVSILALALAIYLPFNMLGQDVLWIKSSEIWMYVWGAAFLFMLLYTAYIELKYRSFFYILTDNEIVIRQGVFSTERVVIPYIKIQNVNVMRSVAQRMLNLATVKIETAGSNAGTCEGILPEVLHHEKLVEEIMSKVMEARMKGQKSSI